MKKRLMITKKNLPYILSIHSYLGVLKKARETDLAGYLENVKEVAEKYAETLERNGDDMDEDLDALAGGIGYLTRQIADLRQEIAQIDADMQRAYLALIDVADILRHPYSTLCIRRHLSMDIPYDWDIVAASMRVDDGIADRNATQTYAPVPTTAESCRTYYKHMLTLIMDIAYGREIHRYPEMYTGGEMYTNQERDDLQSKMHVSLWRLQDIFNRHLGY